MTEHDFILILFGGVIGYCACFVFEIAKATRGQQPPPPPDQIFRREKDPADWWKDTP